MIFSSFLLCNILATLSFYNRAQNWHYFLGFDIWDDGKKFPNLIKRRRKSYPWWSPMNSLCSNREYKRQKRWAAFDCLQKIQCLIGVKTLHCNHSWEVMRRTEAERGRWLCSWPGREGWEERPVQRSEMLETFPVWDVDPLLELSSFLYQLLGLKEAFEMPHLPNSNGYKNEGLDNGPPENPLVGAFTGLPEALLSPLNNNKK